MTTLKELIQRVEALETRLGLTDTIKVTALPKPSSSFEDTRKSNMQKFAPVIQELNRLTGAKFRVDSDKTYELMKTRLIENKITIDEMIAVVRVKVDQWKDDPRMTPYLRPETLFGKQKFEGYLAEAHIAMAKENLYDDFAGKPSV